MPYTVGEVARIAHVSVRALHHYDERGVLTPSERTDAGYRLYTDEDLERLQQVLFHKEIGFSLEEIRELIDDPGFDRTTALVSLRDRVAARAGRLAAMLALIDRTLISLQGGIPMARDEMFESLGDFDPAEYEDEARERWGSTEAYKESARRTKDYTKADWERFKAESDAIMNDAARLLDEGVEPGDRRATAVAERARLQIDTWFYPCDRGMHANLAAMYIEDPRFTATYEKVRPGLARWWHDAILANRDGGARAES